MKENKGAGRPVEFSSIAKRDRDRAQYDSKHSSRRAQRFITPPVSGNRSSK